MKAKNKNLLIILLLYSFKIILVVANHENYANSTYHFQGKSNVDQSRNLLAGVYCGDDHFFTFHDNKKCSYILEKKSVATKRRLNLCKDTNINNACKWSCGHCSDSIVDDPNFKIVKYNGDQKPCQWIGKHNYWLTRQNRRNKYCPKWFEGRKVSDACKVSCANYDIPVHRQQRRKMGIIFNNNANHLKSYTHFGNVVSWTYNFRTSLRFDQGNFADEYWIEYVPMISKPYLLNKNCEFEPGACKKCRLWDPPLELRTCTTQDVIDAVREGVKARVNGPRPYHKPDNYIEPEKAVSFWVNFLQPAAKENNLELISPTTKWKHSYDALLWLAEFLKTCLHNPKCDVDFIHAFNLHSYECEEHLWMINHGGTPSTFKKDIISMIGSSWYGGKDWKQYFANRKVWVTETHCGHWPNPLDSSEEICRKITGQTHSDGRGSIVAMEGLSSIERYAWWTTYSGNMNKHHRYSNNYLTYEDGQLTPAGRGILNPRNSRNINCAFRGTRVHANEAILTGRAILFKCQSIDAFMIKNIGKNIGTATFMISVDKEGDYAINVSLMSVKKQRRLTVSVNNSFIQSFTIQKTIDKWCYEGGRPNVLPLELKGFISGVNSITFGYDDTDSTQWSPLIEWISVVPK